MGKIILIMLLVWLITVGLVVWLRPVTRIEQDYYERLVGKK